MRRHSVKTRLAEALRRASHRSAFELLVNIFVEFFAEDLFSAKFAIFLHHLDQLCRNLRVRCIAAEILGRGALVAEPRRLRDPNVRVGLAGRVGLPDVAHAEANREQLRVGRVERELRRAEA